MSAVHHSHYSESSPLLDGRKRTAGAFPTFINLLKSYMGSGFLGLPYAFKESGIVAGTVIMLAVSLFAGHSMLVLVDCKKKLTQQGHTHVVTFGDMAAFTLGKWGERILNGLLVFTQFGFCCVYVVFIGQNIGSFVDFNWRFVSLMWFPVLLLLSWIRSLKNISWVSAIANIIFYASVITIVVGSCVNISRTISDGHSSSAEMWVILDTLPVTFGIAVYAFEGVGLVLPCETAMKKPEKFPVVLLACLIISTFQYCAFGVLAYYAFGDQTEEQITKNMSTFAGDSTVWKALVDAIKIGLVIVLTATYPLQLFVVTDICEESLLAPPANQYHTINENTTGISNALYWKQNLFRTALVVGTIAVGVSVPNFALLIGLIGALGSAALQFIFPPLFLLKLDPEISPIKKSIMIFYIVFGLGGGILGTVQTIQQMVKDYGS